MWDGPPIGCARMYTHGHAVELKASLVTDVVINQRRDRSCLMRLSLIHIYIRCVGGIRNHGIKNLGSTFARVKKRKFGESTGGSLGIKNEDGEWMGGGWGADGVRMRRV